MTNSTLLQAALLIIAVVLLQAPEKGTPRNITTVSTSERTTAYESINGTTTHVNVVIVIGGIALLFLVIAAVFAIAYCYCGPSSSGDEGGGSRYTDEYRTYHHRSRGYGGSSGGSGGGGGGGGATHTRTPKRHKKRSRSTGHSKDKSKTLAQTVIAVTAAAMGKLKTNGPPPRAKPSHTPHTVKPAARPATGGGGGHHQPTVTLVRGPPQHSTVAGVGGGGGGGAHQHTVVGAPPPARFPKPKAKPAVSPRPSRSTKPKAKQKQLKAVSKVVGPRTPKPRPKSNSAGGGSGGRNDTHETLTTTKCRPSVFFENIREKLAKENHNTKKK